MTEELKYKVGDKVLVEANIIDVDINDNLTPYKIDRKRWTAKDEIIELPPKPKIRQLVMYWFENCEDTFPYIGDYFDYAPTDVKHWLSEDVKNEHALATLIAYGPKAVEVEKEKKYRIFVKNITTLNGYKQCLVYFGSNYSIGQYNEDLDKKYHRDEFTRQEIIKAGFGDVFDNPMFEVEEVE